MMAGKTTTSAYSQQPIELVIFDCDGVLVDSEIICAGVLSRELKALGADVSPEYVLSHFLGHSFASITPRIRQDFGLRLPANFQADYASALRLAFESELSPTQGVVEVLANLRVATCVATSSDPGRAAHALEVTGLDRFFGQHVYTASEVERGKPAPDLFLHAAQQMAMQPHQCLVIEDSLAGLTAAVRADMPVWHYIGGSHLSTRSAGLSGELAVLPVLASWQDFYTMAPHLKRR